MTSRFFFRRIYQGVSFCLLLNLGAQETEIDLRQKREDLVVGGVMGDLLFRFPEWSTSEPWRRS